MPALVQQGAYRFRRAHTDGRRVDDVGGATAGCRRDPPGHLFGGLAVGQAEHHGAGLVGDLVDPSSPGSPLGAPGRTGGVVGYDGQSGCHQVRGEHASHVAQPDESDAADHGVPARIVCHGRR